MTVTVGNWREKGGEPPSFLILLLRATAGKSDLIVIRGVESRFGFDSQNPGVQSEKLVLIVIGGDWKGKETGEPVFIVGARGVGRRAAFVS